MPTEPVENSNSSFPWVWLIAIVFVASQLAIATVLANEYRMTGNNVLSKLIESGQYVAWIVSQLDVMLVFFCIAAATIGKAKTRFTFSLLVSVLLVMHALIGGFVLYVRAMGGLGGLFQF